MTIFATFLVGAPQWVLPAVLLLVLAIVAVGIAYRRVRAVGWTRWAAAGLKILGLAALAGCLIEPLYSGVRAQSGANLFAVIVDNSQSLGISDAPGKPTRGETLNRLIADESAAWQTRLGQDFDLRRYTFDESLNAVDRWNELKFEGPATSLKATLETLYERFRDRPLAGIMLLTDGNATDRADQLKLPNGGPPIYPVILGDEQEARDIAIRGVAVSQSPFEDAPISAKIDVQASGFAGETIVAEILDESGKSITNESVVAEEGLARLGFRLQFAAPKLGVSFYKLRVAVGGDFRVFDDPNQTIEATLANNERQLTVDRGSRPQRVLYVSGRPNWEFKFLRRALASDDSVQLTGLIRIARREPKFQWRGDANDSTNPLFRGFSDGDDEEAEQYDEPVFVRIDTRDETELRGGFPKSAEKLFPFDVVILDDVEAGFFTHDQMSLLDEFVSRRGGSLLMLGGQESFQNGEYQRTPLQDLLPVYLDRTVTPPAGKLRFSLSRDGWLRPWVRLRRNEDDERERLQNMPEFHTLNPLSGIKPGASVLAEVSDEQGTKFPALVVQQYGRGKSAALALGDIWRWALRRESEEEQDHERGMRQMLRWLLADVPGRVDVKAKQTTRSTRIEVRASDDQYHPLDNAAVSVTIETAEGETVSIDAEPTLDEPGLFAVDYLPRTPGQYRINATVKDLTGKLVGEATGGWVFAPGEKEFDRMQPNRELLNRLATESGGQVVEADELEAFVRSLPQRQAPITERFTYPLWHRSTVFLFALSCFIGEWGLRRFRGLP